MSHIFISHATEDDDFVNELRLSLEGQGLKVWTDSRNLVAGQRLDPEIERAIGTARAVLVVLSLNTINSAWVRKEVQKAGEVEKQRKHEGYRVIPLLLEGVKPSALGNWFDEEPVAIPIPLKPGGLSEALPAILAALGERAPTDPESLQEVESRPIEELILELQDPKIEELDEGGRLARATATLIYQPANPTARRVESRRFTFTAPLGPIEADDLRWYLESYYIWPTGVFKERAQRIETQLPRWGQALYRSAMGMQAAQDALNAWRGAAKGANRRFSVWVDPDAPDGSSTEQETGTKEAATRLLALPWELIHDDRGYLFQGKNAVRVRRRLPNRHELEIVQAALPIRILLVSPRPENEHTGYIDHRVSTLPLVSAIENLGEWVELVVLTPPTYQGLQEALRQAGEAGTPFDVVHFNGHGVYDPKHGLGGLCFEDPQDTPKLHQRGMEFVSAERMATVCRDYRIPLVFLEACQSAKAEDDPTASVAAKLLEEGVTSVVAMTHSVLIETARRFVEAFYGELARGARVGEVMLAGQRALEADSYRLKIMGAGELRLQDWFVPVLYQEEGDPQLFTTLLPEVVRELKDKQRRLSLGELPETPPHAFIGRSRELLALERLLHDQNYVVVCGMGGAGKTTLAVELARWLIRTHRFRRAAFVSIESYTDVRGVLDSLGRQLLPDGENWSVAQFSDLKQALQPVQRALADHPTIIVLDNLESVLPDATGKTLPEAESIEALFQLCRNLLNADKATRLLFTSRESLPAPFDYKGRAISLGALSREDAIALVSQVMAQEGLIPKETDPGTISQEITDLVEAVNCHARALVLLAREVARQGVRATTENLHQLMAQLHEKYPEDRENSLYASVELSLRRLSQTSRKQIEALAVFHGGASLSVLAHVLAVNVESARNLARDVIQVGLGEETGYDHLRLVPGLESYLQGKMDRRELQKAQARWVEGMKQLTNFLYLQFFEDTTSAVQLALREIANLLALLASIQETAAPEQVVDVAVKVEELLARLHRPQALAEMQRVRDQATQRLQGWTYVRFEAERSRIERLLEDGEVELAWTRAQQLLQQRLDAGEKAYPEATQDIAMAYNLVGRAFAAKGDAENALKYYAQAQQRFQRLADGGNSAAAHMIPAMISRRGDCLFLLRQLDEAAAAYEEAIKRFENLGDKRWIAVSKYSLGIVRRFQMRFAEALEIFTQARIIFETLGEIRSVAGIVDQIGTVYLGQKHFEQAEQFYRQSLAIRVQQKDRSGEAHSLHNLGDLYTHTDRLEEAVTFYRQAVDIYVNLQNLNREGQARSNLAAILFKLEQYDQARSESHRAIECQEPFGHSAAPWKTWDIVHRLEQATGNPQAAATARQKAIETYRAYRRGGGGSYEASAQLCTMVGQAIKQGNTTEWQQSLTGLSLALHLGGDLSQLILSQHLGTNRARTFDQDVVSRLQAVCPRLLAIVSGDRSPALAAASDLPYDLAAELQLLLESLDA